MGEVCRSPPAQPCQRAQECKALPQSSLSRHSCQTPEAVSYIHVTGKLAPIFKPKYQHLLCPDREESNLIELNLIELPMLQIQL